MRKFATDCQPAVMSPQLTLWAKLGEASTAAEAQEESQKYAQDRDDMTYIGCEILSLLNYYSRCHNQSPMSK